MALFAKQIFYMIYNLPILSILYGHEFGLPWVWRSLNQSSPFINDCLNTLSLPDIDHIYIWQVWPQLGLGDTFNGFNRRFVKSINVHSENSNERSFVKPVPCTKEASTVMVSTSIDMWWVPINVYEIFLLEK